MDLCWMWILLRDSTFWTAVGALATVAATGSILFTVRQLRFQAWLKAQEIFTNSDFTEARTSLFARLLDPTRQWTSKELDAGMLVCRRMDELCQLAPFLGFLSFLGRRAMLKVWGNPIATSWVLLERTVLEERKTGWTQKWKVFAELGEAALQSLPESEQASLIAIRGRLLARKQ